MFDAIGEARVHLLAAKVEIRFARMAQRPLADTVVEVEQRRLARDLGRRLGRHQSARRRGRGRGLLLAGRLAHEATGADRPQDRLRLATRKLAAGDLDVRVLPALRGRQDDLGLLAALFGVSVVLVLLGTWYFKRLEPAFAKVL